MKQNRLNVFTTINYFFFIVLGITMLYPFWYIVMYSLSDPAKEINLGSFYLYPNGFTLDAYKSILGQTFILTAFKNTIIVTIVGTLINLIMTAATAYPLSQRLKGKSWIFTCILFTMIFSGGIIPTYIVVKNFHLVDTLWALMIPSAISVYYMMIMVKFFQEIPVALIESAKIDGYNDLAILFRIILPLSPAVFASIGLFYAVEHWNDYLSGTLYINSSEKNVLPVILKNLLFDESLARRVGRTTSSTTPQTMKMTVVVIAVMPILLVYPFLQKYFIKGIMIGSVKG